MWVDILSYSAFMVARSYILDTKAVQRNSPLVLSSLLLSGVRKYLTQVGREDLAGVISTVTFFRDVVTIVTGKPIINFELRSCEGGLKEAIVKVLAHHGFDHEIHLHFR